MEDPSKELHDEALTLGQTLAKLLNLPPLTMRFSLHFSKDFARVEVEHYPPGDFPAQDLKTVLSQYDLVKRAPEA